MSPQNKKKLDSLRKQLDELDNNLLKIVKKRTHIIKQVLSLKEYKKQIVDKKRINKILSNIKKKSLKNNIDPRITNRIWKSMIWSYIDFEKRNFKKK
jgi:chorismate mutase